MKLQISHPVETDDTEDGGRSASSENTPLAEFADASENAPFSEFADALSCSLDPNLGLTHYDVMEPVPDLIGAFGQMDMYSWSTYHAPPCLGNMPICHPGSPVGFAPSLPVPHLAHAPFIPPAPATAPVIHGEISECTSPNNAPQWSVESPNSD
jgi:hypothetical protein